MPSSDSDRSVAPDTRNGRPSQVAPAPAAALQSRPVAGSRTAPATDSPSRTAATEIAYHGMP